MDKRIITLLICLTIASCGGLRSFHEYARAGDTVAVPVGMQPDFNKDNITVTITPSSGPLIVLNANDPAVRAIINLYPDPVSNMLVSRAIGEDTSPSASTYAQSLKGSTGGDKDWYQTTVFLDLPASLPLGLTQIEVSNSIGNMHSMTLDIIEGTGIANAFNSDFDGGLILNSDILDSLARASHTTVRVGRTSAEPVPHAVEITLSHDPDVTQAGGAGKAFVINPLGYQKNISWNDDGTNMKIIMIKSNEATTVGIKDFKFYVAGTATNLTFGTIKGYDINGNDINNLSATLTASN